MGNPVVEIECASVSFRSGPVLRDISLSIDEEELVGVFGPNGSGKTTLLRLIHGLISPSVGKVTVFGHDATERAASHNGRIAYMPQLLHMDPRVPVSAWDAVMMGRYGRIGLLRHPSKEDSSAVRHALKQVDALHLADRPFGQLSGGEQQRISLARALAQQPSLLLLDEPSASLDWESQVRVRDLVKSACSARGLTTIVVSHDVDMLASICHRIMLIEGGRITKEIDPSQLANCCRDHIRFGTSTSHDS